MPPEPQMRAWPADKVERWPLAAIKPYPNNARAHSEQQVAQIADSMRRFGVTAPVLVDDDGILIYGHGRLRAAQLLALDALPVCIAQGWPEDDKKAYRIADNQHALNSTWDLPALSIELKALDANDFPMPLLGFPATELGALMFPQAAQEHDRERELTHDERVTLNKAWIRVIRDWREIIETAPARGWASTSYTPGALAVHFMRARLHGYEIPAGATLPYTMHRLYCNADKQGPILKLLSSDFDAEAADGYLPSIQWVLQGKPSFDMLTITSTMPIHGHRIAAEFPSALARALIDEFVTKPGGRVLDPCHGWGGRMLGFLLSRHASFYRGCDADPDTVRGVQEMFLDLQPFAAAPKQARLEAICFEDATIEPSSYDFALTSPPYFDVEKYGGEQSSWKRYATFDDWVAGFYKPLIEKTAAALKPNGVFALQIGNQSYPLGRTAIEIADAAGLAHEMTRATGMINNRMQTATDDGEVILLLRRLPTKGRRKRLDPATQFGRVL